MCPNVPTIVTNIVLKKYLEKGTSELPKALTKSEKLFNVGFLTKNLGGYKNISSRGLKALDTVNTSGYALKLPNFGKKMNKAISPPFDLLILFFFFERLVTLKLLISEKGRESIFLDFLSLMSNFSFLAITSHQPF